MKAKYKHTNIIARDWRALANFYQEVFGCVPVLPERHLSGGWLDKGTGVTGAKLSGVHLRLPGWKEDGPTLEIYQYSENQPKLPPAANREGFAHIVFEVDDVHEDLGTLDAGRTDIERLCNGCEIGYLCKQTELTGYCLESILHRHLS